MTNTHNQIKNFITTLQNEYPQLKVDYEYDADEDYYYIKHNSSDLQFNNEEFPQFVGKLIRTYFYNNDIFNISFGYDYYFQKSNIYQMQTNYKNITVKLSTPIFKNILFYDKIDTPNHVLFINNDIFNIKFSLDVKESSSIYTGQTYNQNVEFNQLSNESGLAS